MPLRGGGTDFALVKDMIRIKPLFLTGFGFCMLLLLSACGPDLKPEQSCNFVQNSNLQRVAWKSEVIKMYIHDSVPSEFRDAIKKAAEDWNSIAKNHLIQIESVVGGAVNPARDGYNVIYYITNNWDNDRETEQARTTIYWSGKRIFEADIKINAQDHIFTAQSVPENSKVDMESLILHEFGHVFGLAHVSGEKPSVMHPQLSSGVSRRKISEFDKADMSCEYQMKI